METQEQKCHTSPSEPERPRIASGRRVIRSPCRNTNRGAKRSLHRIRSSTCLGEKNWCCCPERESNVPRATQTFSSRITLGTRSPGPIVSRPFLALRPFPRPQEVSRVPKAEFKNYTCGVFFRAKGPYGGMSTMMLVLRQIMEFFNWLLCKACSKHFTCMNSCEPSLKDPIRRVLLSSHFADEENGSPERLNNFPNITRRAGLS